MVSVYMPAVFDVQDTVAVPEPPVMLLGMIAWQVSPDGTVSVRETVPTNPFWPVTVIVDVADTPTFTAAGEVAVIVKFWAAPNMNTGLVLCDRVPLVPVTITVNDPVDGDEHARVAVPELVTLAGVIAPQVNPAGTVSVSATVPVKPLTALTVIVEVIEVFALPEGDVAVTVKSVTVKVAVAECDSVPLVPVTVTT
jgi:hypothetical protein